MSKSSTPRSVTLRIAEFFELENKLLRKTILACVSGAKMGSIHEKNIGRKSRDTAPLRLNDCRLLHLPQRGTKINIKSEGRKFLHFIVLVLSLVTIFKKCREPQLCIYILK